MNRAFVRFIVAITHPYFALSIMLLCLLMLEAI